MTQTKASDWWERERQRFLKRVLLFLVLVLALIGYFAYINWQGRTGYVSGVNFPTANCIAFVRHEADGSSAIYAVKADGSDLRRLTAGNDASNKEHPAWTPDGKTLVFASNMKDMKTTQLYVLGNGAPVQLTYGAGNKFSPTVSPNGKLVAFISQGVVKTVTITGTDVTQIMPLPRAGNETESGNNVMLESEMGPYLSAAFAPDGATIAGVQDIGNSLIQAQSDAAANSTDRPSTFTALPVDQQVIVLPANANKPYPAVAQGHEVSMAWEPNGTRLACSYTELPMLDAKGQAVDLDGKPLPKGRNPLPIGGIQIWSFVDNVPSHQPIYATLGYSVEPKNVAWSPDGSRLAFELWRLKSEGVREPAGIRVLEIKDPMGRPTNQLYKTAPDDVPNLPLLVAANKDGKPENPRWSPDGRRICYEMQRPDGKRDLWTIDADGTNRINLTKGQGDNSEAAWAPSP
jgi:Tol biopolymer transport system component